MPSSAASYQAIPHSYQMQVSPNRHPSNIAGPSFTHSPLRDGVGMPGVPGGVVGPEAAGLDPSSAEHFFVTLAAYADALDALPLDLTRSFSDLRELDAVLGSHLNSLTSRLHHLTALIEDDTIDRGQRLLALKEVAEEARAYKMGGEDKIRVALNTAETIIGHTDFIDALVEQLDQFPQLSPLLNPKRHLNLEQYYGPEGARLRELLAASMGAGNVPSGSGHGGLTGNSGTSHDANGSSSHKKKKVAASAMGAGKGPRAADNVSLAGSQVSTGPTPSKKRKTVGGSSGQASSNAAGSSKVARTASNTGTKGEEEDWPRTSINASKNGNGASSSSNKKKSESSSKSATAAAAANASNRLPRAAHVSGGYLEGEEDEAKRENGADASSRSRSSRPVRGAATARSDEEEEDPEDEEDDSKQSARRNGSNRTPRVAQVGNAAGASPYTAPGSGSTSASRAESPASTAGGAGNDDADETRYCFCNNVSYGDMIGCDDDDCEREWFHLGCVGLTKPPQGTWYCDACLERRAASGRNKKKGKNGKYETVTSSKSKSSSRR